MRRTPRIVLVLVTLLVAVVVQHAVARAPDTPGREHLRTLPVAMGAWRATSASLPPDILAVLRPDDYLLREYRTAGGPPVTLYIAYYRHQHLDERIHSPSACLPGGGWLPLAVGLQRIAVPGRSPAWIDANRYLIEKGGERQVVLYWFQGRGRSVASDVAASLLLAYDTLRGRGSDEALVRINAPVLTSAPQTLADEVRFAQRLYPSLRDVLPGSSPGQAPPGRAGGGRGQAG